MAIQSAGEWTEPWLGWSILRTTRGETWAPIWSCIGFEPTTDVEFADGRRLAVWGRDFARSPYDDWLARMGSVEIDETGTEPGPDRAWTLVVGAHLEFAAPNRPGRVPCLLPTGPARPGNRRTRCRAGWAGLP